MDEVKILTLDSFLETIMGFVLETRPSKSERVFERTFLRFSAKHILARRALGPAGKSREKHI